MGGIVLMLGGVGVMCASGFVLTTALKWFHSYEVDIDGIRRNSQRAKEMQLNRGGFDHESRINNISKRIQNKS